MEEKTITEIGRAIEEARGHDYVKGMVDMANLLTPKRPEAEAENEAHPA